MPDEDWLRERLRLLARKHPSYGYRRIHVILRREGWVCNRKPNRRHVLRDYQRRDEAERLAEADHGTDWRLEPGEAIALEDVIRHYGRAAGQSA